MRSIIKKIVGPVLKNWYAVKTQRSSTYERDGISIIVSPGIFHPGIFLSTNILIDFLSKKNVNGKKVLELGAGSGFISFYLLDKFGCNVTASDINPEVIVALKKNNEYRTDKINIVQSNLFEELNSNDFEIIVINPPYYPKEPISNPEIAFYCGENFEYFEALFNQLDEQLNSNKTVCYMILSEDCDLDKVNEIASRNNITLNKIETVKKRKELNFIFTLTKN